MPRLILGLGNPGEEYRLTRHNVGFRVVEELHRRSGSPPWEEECRSLVSGETVVLACPQTYMNRSGHAARCLLERRLALPSDLLVVLDDVHLPLGQLRLRRGGSPGGHRGLESVLESLATDEVARLRIGVATAEPVDGEELPDFVLAPFEPGEESAVDEAVGRAADACELWVSEGAEAAMNRVNTRRTRAPLADGRDARESVDSDASD